MKRTTQGVSPKAYVPAIAQVVAGIVLLIAGLDVEGRTLIGSGISTMALGFAAKPGNVTLEQSGEA